MELQDNQQAQELNQTSDVEGTEPVQQAAGGEAAPPAVQEKTGLDKLREKGTVAPKAVSAAEQGAAAVAAFKANIKFKAAGKEMDVPEMFRGLMTDAEKEKYVHTMLSKAHGIEMIQDKLKGTRAERDRAAHAYQEVMAPIQLAREAYQSNDLDTVFNTLQIDRNKVLQWAYKQVELSQMPPEQRQLHEGRLQAERRARDLERQSQEMGQQSLNSQSEQLSQMLDLVLERQDFAAIAQQFDTKRGKEGSFRDLVASMGEQEFSRSGKIITPMEAAKAAVELLGEKLGAPAVAASAAPAPAANQAAAPAAERKITLPNAGGSKAAAPAKSKIASLDDLRKLHQKMASQ